MSKSILKWLADERVVEISLDKEKNQLELTECCDYYFTRFLNKEDAIRLVEEIQALISQMTEPKND